VSFDREAEDLLRYDDRAIDDRFTIRYRQVVDYPDPEKFGRLVEEKLATLPELFLRRVRASMPVVDSHPYNCDGCAMTIPQSHTHLVYRQHDEENEDLCYVSTPLVMMDSRPSCSEILCPLCNQDFLQNRVHLL
jgi:hypothetical protein